MIVRSVDELRDGERHVKSKGWDSIRLLLKKDGSVVVPYNVRLTQSLLDIFGAGLAWISEKTVPYNTSSSYGARNPTSIIVPRFMQVNGLEISHSNSSY